MKKWLTLVVVLAGCQNYEEGIAVWCEAPVTCSDCDHMNGIGQYLESEVSNRRAHIFVESLAGSDLRYMADQLEEEAAALGISPCPMVERYREVADEIDSM